MRHVDPSLAVRWDVSGSHAMPQKGKFCVDLGEDQNVGRWQAVIWEAVVYKINKPKLNEEQKCSTGIQTDGENMEHERVGFLNKI